MSPIGHFAVGLAAKRIAPKTHLGFLLLASWVIDVFWIIFALVGIESMQYDPWSHSLFMAAVWSLLAALLAGAISRDRWTGAVIGLVVFSHWLLDFVSWATLPLFISGATRLGLGLYDNLLFKNPYGGVLATAVELVLFIPGLAIYLRTRGNTGKMGRIMA